MIDENMDIGCRIHVGNDRGTIRYDGEIDGYDGRWIGIEWDDHTRGKHNGTVNNRTYFSTKSSNSGSFVRSNKVSTGVDLITEISAHYQVEDNKQTEVFGQKIVEMVGMTKISAQQSCIHLLRNIVLDNCFVSKPPPQHTPLFINCQELNLYNNLLHRWRHIRSILSFFPNLKELDIRRNSMESAVECYISDDDEWNIKCLKTLILSQTNSTSPTIDRVLKWLPSVCILYCLMNDLSYFDIGISSNHLVILDIENNPIGCFSNIKGKYNFLQKLNVSNCGIQRIVLDKVSRFPVLTQLNLKENSISDWICINELQLLPSVTTLYLDYHHLTSVKDIDVHEVIIAKLPSLRELNRFELSEVERRSAEVRFTNKYSILSDEEKEIHMNDLKRLIEIHGEPVIDTAKKGLNVIRMNISFNNEKIIRSLPLSITVQKLTEMVARQFNLSVLRVSLDLLRDDQIVVFDNPLRSLSHYSPESTDILRVYVNH